jgi:uncharacterized protein DUF1566
MKLSLYPDRHCERVMRSLALAVAVAGFTLLVPGGGPAQAQNPQITTHDTNMTSQHNSQSGQMTTHNSAQNTQHNAIQSQISTHDSNQTTQHNALSQKIDNLSQAWDKTLPANDPGGACPATSSRFTCVMRNAAVLDRETGLLWERSPEATEASWTDGALICINKNVGDRRGWRLPSIPELASLIDPTVAPPGPRLPVGHPFTNVQSAEKGYWSATTMGFDARIAWHVFFGDGGVTGNAKTITAFFWCVRGGMNADVY